MTINLVDLSTVYTDAGIEMFQKLEDYIYYLKEENRARTSDWLDEHSYHYDDEYYEYHPELREEANNERFENILKYTAKFDVDFTKGVIYKKDPINDNCEKIAIIPWHEFNKDFADIKLKWYYCKREKGYITLADTSVAEIGASMQRAQDFIFSFRKGRNYEFKRR